MIPTATTSLTPSDSRDADVLVVGGGVIGLSCGWRLARRGLAVAVIDPEPGSGASWAAAGMLAPITEAAYGEDDLLALGVAGAQRWASFATELTADSGRDPGLRDTGTLVLAHDSGDLGELDRLAAHLDRLQLPAQRLSGRDCRAREPLLAPDVRGGLLAADASVHNRQTVKALLAACSATGVVQVRERAVAVESVGGAVSGVRLEDGTTRQAPVVVVAAGAWTSRIEGLEHVPVRPVRGTILRLGTPPDYLSGGGVLARTVRGIVAGSHVYLVPRSDGELVIGATSEEAGFDDRPTARGVWELLRDARLLLPVVGELTFVEAWSGLRPVTPDNAPLVGATATAGLVIATGHGRNGMLLAPVTADAIAALVVDGAVGEAMTPFSPQRFVMVGATQ